MIAGKETFDRKELSARKELVPEKEVIVGKEPIAGKKVIAHITRSGAAGESKIVATRLPETTRDDPPGNEPEWPRDVSADLARLDLRDSQLARGIGLSFRFPGRLAPTDDVTAIGRRSRESAWV
jgi:hypothetical protein